MLLPRFLNQHAIFRLLDHDSPADSSPALSCARGEAFNRNLGESVKALSSLCQLNFGKLAVRPEQSSTPCKAQHRASGYRQKMPIPSIGLIFGCLDLREFRRGQTQGKRLATTLVGHRFSAACQLAGNSAQQNAAL
jgi:hypothetical protein